MLSEWPLAICASSNSRLVAVGSRNPAQARKLFTIPLPFTPGHIETVVILTLEGQTIHQRFAPVDQYRLEVEHFATCIRYGNQLPLSLEETIENLATIEAIYQSAGYSWPFI